MFPPHYLKHCRSDSLVQDFSTSSALAFDIDVAFLGDKLDARYINI